MAALRPNLWLLPTRSFLQSSLSPFPSRLPSLLSPRRNYVTATTEPGAGTPTHDTVIAESLSRSQPENGMNDGSESANEFPAASGVGTSFMLPDKPVGKRGVERTRVLVPSGTPVTTQLRPLPTPAYVYLPLTVWDNTRSSTYAPNLPFPREASQKSPFTEEGLPTAEPVTETPDGPEASTSSSTLEESALAPTSSKESSKSTEVSSLDLSLSSSYLVPLLSPLFNLSATSPTSYTHLLHSLITRTLSSLRQNPASTLQRSRVRASGKKIRPQKGSGRARAGAITSPIFKGGGVTFGPGQGGNTWDRWYLGMNKKDREKAVRVAMSNKWARGDVIVVDGWGRGSETENGSGVRGNKQKASVDESEEDGVLLGGKTKALRKRLDELGIGTDCLLVVGEGEDLIATSGNPSASSSSPSPTESTTGSKKVDSEGGEEGESLTEKTASSPSPSHPQSSSLVTPKGISELQRAGRNLQKVDVVRWDEVEPYALLLRKKVVFDLESLGWWQGKYWRGLGQ